MVLEGDEEEGVECFWQISSSSQDIAAPLIKNICFSVKHLKKNIPWMASWRGRHPKTQRHLVLALPRSYFLVVLRISAILCKKRKTWESEHLRQGYCKTTVQEQGISGYLRTLRDSFLHRSGQVCLNLNGIPEEKGNVCTPQHPGLQVKHRH